MPHTWKFIEYVVVNDAGKKKFKIDAIGSFTQFPLKLAWAITIHKSQGQTYDAVNIDPYAWDPGQLYVALSRTTSITNMHFLKPIYRHYLIADKAVTNFYKTIEDTN